MTKLKHLSPLFLLIFSTLKTQAQEIDSSKNERISIHFQTTVINQFKPSFQASYTGPNSLETGLESRTSITSTLFLGAKMWKGASIYLNPEIAGGSGLSKTTGIAAATNGETFRVGDPSPQIYLARLFVKQRFALTSERSFREADFNQPGEFIPNTYLSFTIGKVSIADYFDSNKYSHDPKTQFMSWALMSNGGWDYPANTRGYTPSIVLEFVSPKVELRYGFSLVPKTANGQLMNWDISKARSHTLEYTKHTQINSREGSVRFLVFYTTANMGNYAESIAMNPNKPSIELTRKNGNTKWGMGINADQNFTNNLGGFFRASWNDGRNETWEFTEIDHSISAGLTLNGNPWKRQNDKLGFAYVASGISKEHQNYLKAGGSGFMLGDGQLNYAWEQLTEMYYAAELIEKKIFLSAAYQMVINPGYNMDRKGPVQVISLRLHARI